MTTYRPTLNAYYASARHVCDSCFDLPLAPAYLVSEVMRPSMGSVPPPFDPTPCAGPVSRPVSDSPGWDAGIFS